MRLVTGYDADIRRWLAANHNAYVHQEPSVLLGIVEDNALVGAFIITWRTDTTAELGVYGTVSPDTVKNMFRFVFGQCRIHRLEVRTPKKNKVVRKAAPKFGFQFEGSARDYYGPGVNALVFAMTIQQCRWLERHG